jgi:hypothetical protein
MGSKVKRGWKGLGAIFSTEIQMICQAVAGADGVLGELLGWVRLLAGALLLRWFMEPSVLDAELRSGLVLCGGFFLRDGLSII